MFMYKKNLEFEELKKEVETQQPKVQQLKKNYYEFKIDLLRPVSCFLLTIFGFVQNWKSCFTC